MSGRMILVFTFLLMGAGPVREPDVPKPVMPVAVREIVEWLPSDSESLIVSQGPITFKKATFPTYSFLESIRVAPYSLIMSFQNEALYELLQGQKITLAVEGSRRFRSPVSLGLLPYEGCQVLMFDPGAHQSVAEAFQICLQRARRTISIEKLKVAVFTDRREQDDWTLYLAQPRAGILLCATNQDYLEETLKRMQSQQPKRAFPDTLEEWKYLNTEASVWGLRHFSAKFSKTDPTSPFDEGSGGVLPDKDAIGFVYWFDPQQDQIARAVYLSKSKKAAEIVQLRWQYEEEKLNPIIREREPGILEIAEPVDGDPEEWYYFYMILMCHLGHAVYL
ncbi:hypothetical protein [Gimesia sp.]|uniref:hypothetical protein n=1 Tax=Gimesia sp. TaxID=2024833 RepID=UPI003A8D279F